MKDNRDRLVRVFSGNLWQAQIVQSLLEANDIECLLKNDTVSAVTAPYLEPGGVVWVLVNIVDEEVAMGVIRENSHPSNPYN